MKTNEEKMLLTENELKETVGGRLVQDPDTGEWYNVYTPIASGGIHVWHM